MAEISFLRIPAALEGATRLVSAMPDDEFDRLVELLGGFDGDRPELLHSAIEEALAVDSAQAGELVSLVLSFESLRDTNEWTPAETGEAVARATNSPAESDSDRETLGARIERILGFSTTTFLTRVVDALQSNEQVWRGAKIYSDLRAVFTDDGGFMGAVPIARFEISYIGADGHSETAHYSLDEEGLVALGEEITRAQKHIRELRAHFSKAGIRLTSVPPGGEDG